MSQSLQTHLTSSPPPISSDSQPIQPSGRPTPTPIIILHQLYALLLLCLPLLYAARVHEHIRSSPHSTSASSWNDLLHILIAEWKMLQITSAALPPAIFAIFQLTGGSTYPLMRTAAFVSFVCAFVSFLSGSLLIIYFSTSEAIPEDANGNTNRVSASELEAATNPRRRWSETFYAAATQNQYKYAFWNIWVLLALPAIWTAWSVITFAVFLLLFLWPTDTSTGSFMPDMHLSLRDQVTAAEVITGLLPRLTATVVFLIGIVYLALAIHTLCSRPGKT